MENRGQEILLFSFVNFFEDFSAGPFSIAIGFCSFTDASFEDKADVQWYISHSHPLLSEPFGCHLCLISASDPERVGCSD
jgi:hypothetical protein